MDDQLVGYALKALPAAEMAEVERAVADDPAAAAKLARLRAFFARLSAAAEHDPPPGLAVATLAAIANHIVENKLPLEGDSGAETAKCSAASDFHPVFGDLHPADSTFEELPPVPASPSAYPVRRWFEVALVAAIAFLTIGLVTTGMMKIRSDGQIATCKNNMLKLYEGLSGYADTHNDQFPKVGTPAAPNAGSFVSELQVARQLMPDVRAVCPADTTDTNDKLHRVSYVYTLGYQLNGEVRGIRRRVQDISDELTPLLADLPTSAVSPADGPLSPHGKGQNILFADGHVRFSILATVNDDDIYKNQNGRVRAGLHRFDASLGRPTDVP
jgi:prepilin-type processing-associated H-X9-DG protein